VLKENEALLDRGLEISTKRASVEAESPDQGQGYRPRSRVGGSQLRVSPTVHDDEGREGTLTPSNTNNGGTPGYKVELPEQVKHRATK
jgi:hypothetical protein